MKKFPLFRLVSLATAALLSAASAEETNGIAAVVNGRPILRSEVEEVIKVQGMQLRATIGDKAELDRELGDLRKKALDTLVEQELILKEFEPYAENFMVKVDAYADERIKTQYVKEMFIGDEAKFV